MFSLGAILPYTEGFFRNFLGKYILLIFLFLKGYLFQIFLIASLILFFRLFFVFLDYYKKWKKSLRFYSQLSLKDIIEISKKNKKKIPSFTIFIPAREEALVIRKTLYRMSEINYPLEKMEIVVITDEKERLNRKNNQKITQEEVEGVIKELKKEKPSLKIYHLEVPYDFNGQIFGERILKEVPSTKGRALNYGLTFFNKSDFCAFFDTDDYPDRNCLLAVAYEYLKNPKKCLFQMPIFQCRNFWFISTFSKVISLGQALTHEIFLPWILTWLPFLGGTNFFIKTEYLLKVKGFRLDSITEDLELGVRLFLEENKWPIFLPLASSEQTPLNFSQYFRQRQRWALGQIHVLNELRVIQKDTSLNKKIKNKAKNLYFKLILYGPIEWIIYFSMTLFGSFVLIFSLLKGVAVLFYVNNFSYFTDPNFLINKSFNYLFFFLRVSLFLVIFTFYLYFRYRKFIQLPSLSLKFIFQILKSILEIIFVLPFIIFLYPLPFVTAFFKHLILFNKKEIVWIKTPRTVEN